MRFQWVVAAIFATSCGAFSFSEGAAMESWPDGSSRIDLQTGSSYSWREISCAPGAAVCSTRICQYGGTDCSGWLQVARAHPVVDESGGYGGGSTYVNGYYRRNGTYVRGYTRRR